MRTFEIYQGSKRLGEGVEWTDGAVSVELANDMGGTRTKRLESTGEARRYLAANGCEMRWIGAG